jgi:hypothetical protein
MKKWLGRISIALSNIEKNATNQTGEQLSSDVTHLQRHTQGQIADSLINGEVTQEIMDLRWRTYKILNETGNYSSKIIGYETDGTPITETIKKDYKKGLNKIKLDTFDSYPLEMVVNNDDIVIGGTDAMNNAHIILLDKASMNYDDDGNLISATHGEISSDEYFATTKNDKPIIIRSEQTRQFCIERYTKKLNIRKISNSERLLEFYVSKYPDEYNRSSRFFLSDLKKAIENPDKCNMLEINYVDFISNKTIGVSDYLEFSYEITSFDKIVEFNGNYVIKFKANVIVNGENILLKYKQDELENKYNNKTKK